MTATPPVTFSDATWVAMFPEFTPLTTAQGQAYFNMACLICGNSCTNPAFGDGNLSSLLYFLTSHFAWLNCPKDGNGNPAATGGAASPLVGRISSANEGSVSVQTEWTGGDKSSLESFLLQTKYGAAYYAMTSQYRTARYVGVPRGVINGAYPGYLWR